MALTRTQTETQIANLVTDPLNKQNTAQKVRDAIKLVIDNFANLEEDPVSDSTANEIPFSSVIDLSKDASMADTTLTGPVTFSLGANPQNQKVVSVKLNGGGNPVTFPSNFVIINGGVFDENGDNRIMFAYMESSSEVWLTISSSAAGTGDTEAPTAPTGLTAINVTDTEAPTAPSGLTAVNV